MSWFIKTKDSESGPLSSKELKELARAGKLKESDFVRRDEMTNWIAASKVNGLFQDNPAPASKSGLNVAVPPPLPKKGPPPLPKKPQADATQSDVLSTAKDIPSAIPVDEPSSPPLPKKGPPPLPKKAEPPPSQEAASPIFDVLLKELQLVPDDPAVFKHPSIPEKKLSNARQAYATGMKPDEPALCLVDTTVFGSAKEGCLFTTEGVYWHNTMSATGSRTYCSLVDCQIEPTCTFFNKRLVLSSDTYIDLGIAKPPAVNALAVFLKSAAKLLSGRSSVSANPTDVQLVVTAPEPPLPSVPTDLQPATSAAVVAPAPGNVPPTTQPVSVPAVQDAPQTVQAAENAASSAAGESPPGNFISRGWADFKQGLEKGWNKNRSDAETTTAQAPQTTPTAPTTPPSPVVSTPPTPTAGESQQGNFISKGWTDFKEGLAKGWNKNNPGSANESPPASSPAPSAIPASGTPSTSAQADSATPPGQNAREIARKATSTILGGLAAGAGAIFRAIAYYKCPSCGERAGGEIRRQTEGREQFVRTPTFGTVGYNPHAPYQKQIVITRYYIRISIRCNSCSHEWDVPQIEENVA